MFDRDKPYATVIEPGRRAFLQDGVLYAPDGRRLSPPAEDRHVVDVLPAEPAEVAWGGGGRPDDWIEGETTRFIDPPVTVTVGPTIPAGWRNLPLTELRALAASLGITEKRKVGIIRAIQAMETA